ncbi:hypothetical protein BJ878DRAFT_278442 [Calycina marina]|uniref:Uncharacterized protein n=1 Tax=Calycina marina TaxID=1763456 RepID=A0A9P7YWN8_9HELO|nr:hypothetical protein BJ878DRAFT_278442 [Calycina marina]
MHSLDGHLQQLCSVRANLLFLQMPLAILPVCLHVTYLIFYHRSVAQPGLIPGIACYTIRGAISLSLLGVDVLRHHHHSHGHTGRNTSRFPALDDLPSRCIFLLWYSLNLSQR